MQLSFVISNAQIPSKANSILEGSKVLIDLVKIFKKGVVQDGLHNTDNISSDICFTNSTHENLYIELSRKLNDTIYRTLPNSVSLTANSHECLLELSPNVYHYRIYKRMNTTLLLSLEGEIKLVPNEKIEHEIK